jgi:hypothetical protein
MIIIAYPCATGGKFIASLVAMIVHGSNNNILQNGSLHNTPNGFVQYHVEDTSNNPDVLEAEWKGFQKFLETNTNSVIVSHMRNLAQVIDNIDLDQDRYTQALNFINEYVKINEYDNR